MKIGVIGAGPAGLMAAISAAQSGARVTLFEKNAMPGRKLLLTGNGRCNLTNRLSLDEYPDRYFGNGKFLIKALYAFGPEDTERFFVGSGVRLTEEAGGRVFPESGHAADILTALSEGASGLGVRFAGTESVLDLRKNRAGKIAKIITTDGTHEIDACVLATGGNAYPTTGSSGDGAVIASRIGHTIVPPRPSLAPVDIIPEELPMIPGVSLSEVKVTVYADGKIAAKRKGDVLYTHYGLSGPAVLSLARYLPTDPAGYDGRVQVELDLWPDAAEENAGERMMKLLSDNRNIKVTQALRGWFPASVIEHLFERAGVSSDVYGRDLKKEDRKALLRNIRALSYRVARPPLFSTAMVTAGGVSIREVDPKTMQSRIVDGLFFAGEILDIDGETGGFNLQAAFSTGFLAGRSAAEYVGHLG